MPESSTTPERITIEVRLFNSLSRYGQGRLELPAGSTVADALARLAVPGSAIFLSLLNGRNISRSLGGGVEGDHRLRDGDCLALSGPVPFSRGYGAPVV